MNTLIQSVHNSGIGDEGGSKGISFSMDIDQLQKCTQLDGQTDATKSICFTKARQLMNILVGSKII